MELSFHRTKVTRGKFEVDFINCASDKSKVSNFNQISEDPGLDNVNNISSQISLDKNNIDTKNKPCELPLVADNAEIREYKDKNLLVQPLVIMCVCALTAQLD